jgi:AbrB family looped-hinge helix DNA binding protein
MRTTIDGAGRVVIPKVIRDEAGLHAGVDVDIHLRDGRIEIEAATVPMRVGERDGRAVIEAEGEMPALTDEAVRDILERIRR